MITRAGTHAPLALLTMFRPCFGLTATALAVLGLAAPLASAQTAAPAPTLDTIVVTPARASQMLDEAIGDVSVINRATLDRAGQESLAEVLAREPGVQFYSNGGPQAQTGVSLRGANPAHTLVLVNGIRVNGSTQAGMHWNALDPAVIERVEVLRGAASSLYGSDAMGGVVNIITREPDGADRPLSAWATLGAGSRGTWRVGAGLSGAQDGWDYRIAASHGRSRGHDATTAQLAGTHHPDRDGYREHAVSAALGYQWQPGQHIGVTAYNGYVRGDHDAGLFLHPAQTVTRLQAYTLTSTNRLTSYWQSVLRFGWTKESIQDYAYDSRYSTTQRSYSWQNNFTLTPQQALSVLLERLEERPDYTPRFPVNQRNTNAAALVYRGESGPHHWQASVRHDRMSGYGARTTGSLGYALDITEHWRVGVAGNTGFRAPTFIDLYSPYAPSPDLRPEKSRNIEASIRYQNGDTQVSLVAYHNRMRDLIALDSQRAWAAFNIDRATIRGVTLSGEHRIGNTTLRASADWLRPRDDATGLDLVRRARQVYRLQAEHRFGDLSVGSEFVFTGRRYDDKANQRRLGGYGLLNLTAAYDIRRDLRVQARWDNVFNRRGHTNAYGYGMPGSTIFVELRWQM